MKTKLIAVMVLAIALISAYFYVSRAERVHETPAVAIRQPDNSLILARKPDVKLSKAPHNIPQGMKEQRRVSVIYQPTKADCPDATIVLSYVDDREGGHRVIASATNGVIADGVDIPLVPITKPKLWVVGLTLDADKQKGIYLARDFNRVQVIAHISESSSAIGLGFRF